MTDPSIALVLDEHLSRLRNPLRERGIETRTVKDFDAESVKDPEVVRAIGAALDPMPWVLVTMDLTIVEDFSGFDWTRYALAWVVIGPHLRGIEVEQDKADVVHRHAHQMVAQRPPDHFTYMRGHRHKSPPSLVSQLKRSDPFRA